jgi:hypothetical protein
MFPITADTTCLYFINLNVITLNKKEAKFHNICKEIQMANVHLFTAAKHNLDTNKFISCQSLQDIDIARKSFQHYALQTATSSIPAKDKASWPKPMYYHFYLHLPPSMHLSHKQDWNHHLPPTGKPAQAEKCKKGQTTQIIPSW